MMVQIFPIPAASMYMVVRLGMWTNAAHNRGWPLMSDPSVYTQFSGVNLGVHGFETEGGPRRERGPAAAPIYKWGMYTTVGSG